MRNQVQVWQVTVRRACRHPSSCLAQPLGAPSLLRVRPSATPANSRSRRGTPAHGRAAPTSCARACSPAPYAPRACFAAVSRPGRALPGRCPASGGVLPCLGRIGPRPHGSDRSVSVSPIDAAATFIGQNPTPDTEILDQKDDVMVFSNEAEVTGRIHRICEVMALAECCARARRIAPSTLSHRASRSSTWPDVSRDGQRPRPMGDRFRAVAFQPPAVRPRVAGVRAGVPGPGVLRALVPPQWLRGFGRGDRAAFAWLATGAAAALPATMEW